MTLGGKIREVRRRCGLSQEQLAEKLCVSRSAIAKWETDKGLPDVGNLKVLSKLLSVSLDYLLDDEEADRCPVIRQRYVLAHYGRGCNRIKKDRLVREKFPQARKFPLFGRRELPVNEERQACGCAAGERREADQQFYLVEQGGRQLLVTVGDDFIETRLLEQSVMTERFCVDGWCFIKSNYEIL